MKNNSNYEEVLKQYNDLSLNYAYLAGLIQGFVSQSKAGDHIKMVVEGAGTYLARLPMFQASEDPSGMVFWTKYTDGD